jgi:hypothetical protein
MVDWPEALGRWRNSLERRLVRSIADSVRVIALIRRGTLDMLG